MSDDDNNTNTTELAISQNSLDVVETLKQLSTMMSEIISTVTDNRNQAIKHKEDLQKQLQACKNEFGMSEDGILEGEITKTIKIINDSSKALQAPIRAITDILKTQMIAQAMKNKTPFYPPGKKPVTQPINLSDYEDDEDHNYEPDDD